MVKYINNTTAQAMINGFKGKFGNNSALKTTSKNFVGAINELKLAIANLPQPQLDTTHVAGYPINIVETPYNGLVDTNLSNFEAGATYVKLNNGRIVTGFAANRKDHSYTDDGGATWKAPRTSEITNFYGWTYINDVQVDSYGNIFTIYYRTSSDTIGCACVSTDNGESYHKVEYNGYTFINVMVDNVNNKLYGLVQNLNTGDCSLIISSDGGVTWDEPSNNVIPSPKERSLYTTDTNNIFLRIGNGSNSAKWFLVTDNFTKCIVIPSDVFGVTQRDNFLFIDNTHFICTSKTTKTTSGQTIGVSIQTFEIKDDTVKSVSSTLIFQGTPQAYEAVQKIIKHDNKYIAVGYYVHTSTDGITWTKTIDFITGILSPDNIFNNIMLVPYIDTNTKDIRCKCSNDYGETWNDSILVKSSEKTVCIVQQDYVGIYDDGTVYSMSSGQRPNFKYYKFYKANNSNKIIFGNRYGSESYDPSTTAYNAKGDTIRRFFGYKYTIDDGVSWQNTGDTQSVYVNGTQSSSDKIAAIKLEFIEHENNGVDRGNGSIYQAYQSKPCVIDMSN